MTLPSGDGLGPCQTRRQGWTLCTRASPSGYPSVGTSLKKENTASGSCASGEQMGSIDCDDSTGELCSTAADISNRDLAVLHRETSPLQSLLRRIDLKLAVCGSSRPMLSSTVVDPSYYLLSKLCPARWERTFDGPARLDQGVPWMSYTMSCDFVLVIALTKVNLMIGIASQPIGLRAWGHARSLLGPRIARGIASRKFGPYK